MHHPEAEPTGCVAGALPWGLCLGSSSVLPRVLEFPNSFCIQSLSVGWFLSPPFRALLVLCPLGASPLPLRGWDRSARWREVGAGVTVGRGDSQVGGRRGRGQHGASQMPPASLKQAWALRLRVTSPAPVGTGGARSGTAPWALQEGSFLPVADVLLSAQANWLLRLSISGTWVLSMLSCRG